MRRVATRWVAVKMPELKGQDPDTLLNMYMKSDHCKKMTMDWKDIKGPQKKKTTH